jgi:hypothetical protein
MRTNFIGGTMAQPTGTIDGSLRYLRIIHGVMLFAMILYVFTAEKLIPHQPRDLNNAFPETFGILSLTSIGLALFFRRNKIQPATETLQLKPDDAVALLQWRTAGILTAVLLEIVVLFGFALRNLGAPLRVSLPFYVVGIALMVLWWPQRP